MIRKTLIRLMVIAVCMVSMTSCNLNRIKNQADFSGFGVDSLSIDARWGIPVIKAEFMLGDYLSVLDSIEFIDTTGGSYRFVYEIDKDTLLKVSDYLDTIDNISLDGISTSFNFDIPGAGMFAGIGVKLTQRIDQMVQFAFNIDQFALDEVEFDEGNLLFDSVYLDVDTNRLQIDTIMLYLDQFTNAMGDTLNVVFDATVFENHTVTVPLAGYHISMPVGGQLSVSAYMSATVYAGTVSSTEIFNVGFAHFLLSDMEVNHLTGRIATQEIAINQSMEFNFDVPSLDGSISIMHPNIVISTLNTTGLEAEVVVDKAEFSNSGANAWELFQNPADKTIELPASNSFVDNTINIDEIKFSTDYNRFDFQGRGILSPDGLSSASPFTVTPSTVMGFGLRVDVPLSLKIDDLSYSMNILDDLTLGEQLEADDIDFIDTLALRIHVNHNLPVSFTPQLYMYDENDVLIDTLFKSNQFITRSYGEEVQNVVEVYITGSSIERLLETKKIDMCVSLDTNDDEAQIDKNAYIKVLAGAKLTYTSLPNVMNSTTKEGK